METPVPRIANLVGPAVGALLRAHPSRPDVVDLPATAFDAIPADRDVVFSLLRGLDGPPPPRPAAWPGGLRWVQIASAGLDDYPAWILDAPLVTTARGTTSETIAEWTLAAMLARAKRIPELFVTDGAWPPGDTAGGTPLGTLRGTTLGLVGTGAIGLAVVRLARAFGMRILATRRSPEPIDGVEIAPLDAVLAAAHHLVLAAPLTPETEGLLGDEAFARLRRGAHLVNVARGAIVDQEALLRALDRDPGLTATLDVTTPEPLPSGHPLYRHPRVRISPHRSYSSPTTALDVARLFQDNLTRYVAGEPLRNVVDPARGY